MDTIHPNDDVMDDGPTELTDEERAAMRSDGPVPVDAPDDIDADAATGYAVFNRTTGQFVGGVTTDKPSSTEARKLVPKGHSYATVRV